MDVGWGGGWQNASNDAPAIEDRGPQLYSHAQTYIAAHICSHTDFVHKHIYIGPTDIAVNISSAMAALRPVQK